MHLPIPITRELLFVGGGHAHALVLKMWGMNPLPGVRVTVINPNPTAPYSGMLPGFVAGHYTRDELDIDLVQLARFANARLIAGRAVDIDTNARVVTLEDGRTLPYHIASIDVGITSAMPDMKGFTKHAIPAKPLDRFAQTWDDFRARATTGTKPVRVAVIGGGVAGIELVLAMAHALKTGGATDPSVTLIDRSQIAPELPETRREFFREQLKLEGINLLENSPIASFGVKHIKLENGNRVEADYTVGAAGARPQAWLSQSNLAMENGFVKVDATLRSINTPDVFAVGDCAHLTHAPVPKAGVFAVREAPILLANLKAALTGGRMKSYQPQKDYLKLISLGQKSALADKWGRMFVGAHVWRLKDRIDVKFMDQFRDLKPMAPAPLPATVAMGVRELTDAAPLCGGCGAKIGSSALLGALSDLPNSTRADVVNGPGDDAGVLKSGAGFQVLSTDQLRSFTHDTGLMARIAAIHALGDVWAMGARAQVALANVILPPLSPDLQQAWLGEIMGAAGKVFAAEGADIIGGHSSQGAELSIGFTVTGLRKSKPITKAGAKPGDALILTKPIGTGTILAGEMAMRARGPWVMDAFETMAQAQGDWAGVLSGAHAMGDVTGFGLAGHLHEIATASNVGINLDLDAVPLLDGALELAEQGVRSSLFAENRAMAADIIAPDSAKTDLLFDPQTAGGLLAAVPLRSVNKILEELQESGNQPAVIGHCTKASDGFRVV